MVCLMKKRIMKKRIVLNDYDGKVITGIPSGWTVQTA